MAADKRRFYRLSAPFDCKEVRTTAFHFFKWLRGQDGKGENREIVCKELIEAAQEYQIRELSFWVCVNMIANALGRCEFRTYRNHEEVREGEYYMWNYSPNVNENSTMFLHKLIAKLYMHNEALIVETLPQKHTDALVVADSWDIPEAWPSRQNEYKNVVVGDYRYQYPIWENDALHLKLNHTDIRPVLNGLYESYYRLIRAAEKSYTWENGQHWKVHVSQILQNDPGWMESFQKMIEKQVKPFLQSDGAILPEFDGYEYKREASSGSKDTRDIKNLTEDIFEFTARSFLIPAVLVQGTVEGTADANNRFLTYCIDPLCDQLQEEINRKHYGYEEWKHGNYLRVDSSSIIHFDIFENAANVEKLIGSGAFTINDVRRAAGQSAIPEPWADEHFMTLNISTMTESTKTVHEEGNRK